MKWSETVPGRLENEARRVETLKRCDELIGEVLYQTNAKGLLSLSQCSALLATLNAKRREFKQQAFAADGQRKRWNEAGHDRERYDFASE